LRDCGTIRASESTPIIWFLRLVIGMPDAHPSGILLTTTPGKSLAGRDLTSFRTVSPRGPAGQADAKANPLAQVIPELSLAASARRLPQSTPVRFAAMRVMLYCRVPSRALGVGAGGIAVLPRALAGDTGAFLVPAEAHAARPAWPAEFRGQYTGIKTIGADLRIDVQRSYTRPGVCSRRPGMS